MFFNVILLIFHTFLLNYRNFGGNMNNVLIVNIDDTGNEGEALRQVLERMNYSVFMKRMGRPKDLIDILKGDFYDFDFLILSCHGTDGNIVMPVLGENIYFENEPRGNF